MIRPISEGDAWVTNDDGDIIGIQLHGRSEIVDLSNPVNSKVNPVTGGIGFSGVSVAGYSQVPIAYEDGFYIDKGTGSKNRVSGFKSSIIPVLGGDNIRVTALISGGVCALAVYFDAAGNCLGHEFSGQDGVNSLYEKQRLTVPDSARFIGFTQPDWADPALVEIYRAPSLVDLDGEFDRLWRSNKSQWAGKKIAWFGTSIPEGGGKASYPQKVCDALGALCVNEAVGSSMARNGVAASRSGEDPYGWAGLAWQNVAWALSATLAEKQYLIDNWASVRTMLTNSPPETLQPWDVAKILDCSWENKLTRNLGSNRADLYVFDHGHNDNLVGITGGAADVTVADQRDRGTFAGAMAYLIDKILADNPKAKICFIGHYENKVAWKVSISIAQKAVAEYWSYPLVPLWEKLGWTQQSITSGGVTKTMTQWMMPDDLHPSSDTTGYAIGKIADTLIPFVRDLR